MIETEIWKNINPKEQGPETIEATGKTTTVQADTDVKKKPIHETRAILDYREWDQLKDDGKQVGCVYLVAWKGYPDETWQSIKDLMTSGGIYRRILG